MLRSELVGAPCFLVLIRFGESQTLGATKPKRWLVDGTYLYDRPVPRSKSDISNMSVRIFLHEMGVTYDVERNLEPYSKRKHFESIKLFFEHRCCYCGAPFESNRRAVEDHLIPTNQTSLGLHAWGNIVPSCDDCNAKKQGSDWKDFIIERAGSLAKERHSRMKEFIELHQYHPHADLSQIASELYREVGEIAMALIRSKIDRARETI